MFRKIFSLFLILLLCGCTATKPETTTEQTELTQTTEATFPPAENTVATQPHVADTEPTFDPYRIVDSLSVEEQVSQLFLARYPGHGQAIIDADKMHIGGYILFGKDFENDNPVTIRQAISACQSAAAIPMLIAVDEEGGSVTRVSSYPQYRSEPFPSPRKLYQQGGLSLVLKTEEEKLQLLSNLGINVNMAPVCDVTTDPQAFMYSRSLGQDPQIIGAFAAGVQQLSDRYGVGCVLKHFPGYGNNTDTHVGIAIDERPIAQLEQEDLLPYRMAIQDGCDAILVSHTVIQSIDPIFPASLSPAVIHYLRSELGFKGVAVTDDLVMDAITDRYGAKDAAVMAVIAGCDLLCSSEYAIQYDAVLQAVRENRIPAEQIREAAARVIVWKHKLGLFP